MNGLLLAGIITSICFLLILLFLSIWIGTIGLIIGLELTIGGALSNKEEYKDKNEE